MKRITLFLILIYSLSIGYSQKTLKVSADYTYYAPETLSIEEAKRIALERAKIQSIADNFGTVISQNTSTSISNNNGVSNTHFFILSGSDVRGEWIETIGSPLYNITLDNMCVIVHCTVNGYIREIPLENIEIIIKTLKNGTSVRFASDSFVDGDELYLYFMSSAPGNIQVFLQQNESVYKLLPYKREITTSETIEKNKEYIFFSKKHSEDKAKVDEYDLYADKDIDAANIILLFSPSSIVNNTFIETKYDEPQNTDLSSFNKWLVKRRNKDLTLRVITLPITIKKQ